MTASTSLAVFVGCMLMNFYCVYGSLSSNSKLKVQFPMELQTTDGYEHREALFGISPYGGSIQASLYYVKDVLCSGNGINMVDVYPKITSEGDGDIMKSPFVLMMDRGECTFVQKVRYAQHFGAVGVLIADNLCICGDDQCSVTPGTKCETSEPIMADDGSGGDVSIPSFLLYKKDADKFIDMVVVQNRQVIVDMSWSMPNPDDHVEYDLWTTPLNPVTRDFLLNWAPVANAFGDRAYFTPHMYIYDGNRVGCVSRDYGTNTSNCLNLCTNSGRYCGTDPDDDLSQGLSGADVVTESLRRICLWHDYGAPNGVGVKWWEYMSQFITSCETSDRFKDSTCIEQVYKSTGIDGSRVDSCMKDSGSGDGINSKLDEEILQQTKQGVVILPSAFINKAPMRGALTVPNVFQAICSGFAEGTAPTICYQCSSCADIPECIRIGKCSSFQYGSSAVSTTYSSKGSDLVSFQTFFFWMLLLVGALGTAGMMYKNRTEETMRTHVRSLLADYMPLQDQDGNPNSNNAYHPSNNGGGSGLLSSMVMSSNGFFPNGNNSSMMMSSQQSQQYYPQQQQQQYAQPNMMMHHQQQMPMQPQQTQFYGDIHNANSQYSAPNIPQQQQPFNNTNSQMTSLLS